MTDDTVKHSKLLPCAHCGGEAIYEDEGWGRGKHIILCTARVNGCRLCPRIYYEKLDIGKEMMFEIWNKRTPTNQVQQYREALEKGFKIVDKLRHTDLSDNNNLLLALLALDGILGNALKGESK